MSTRPVSPKYVQLQNMYQPGDGNTPYRIEVDSGLSSRTVVDVLRKASPELLRLIEQQKHGS